MTPEQRAELEALCAKATPGPWSIDWSGTRTQGLLPNIYRLNDHNDRRRLQIDLEVRSPIRGEAEANARLIAAARTAVPELLADLKAAEAREKALREALERNRQGYKNILELRKLVGGFGLYRETRYGALTREEIEQVIGEIDAALEATKETHKC